MQFNIDKKNNTVDYLNNISGRINSTCNVLEFSFMISLKNVNLENTVITSYSVLMSIICLASIINTVWINLKLNESETYAKSISLLTVYENIIWNFYGCLCHFFLTINYAKYFVHFLIPTIFYFINFSVTDLRFLYSLWRLKYSRFLSDPTLVRKKLLQLYLIFYLVMFFSLFYITKFYFSKPYILLGIALTWIPQIIYNALYNNKISMPWIYIIFTSFYRLFIPCYFRGNKENFFLISPDYQFVVLCLITMLVFMSIMYTQILFGGRWFLSKRCKKDPFDFYKTKEEILLMKTDAENLECVICLNPLFGSENTKYFENDFISAGEHENIQIISEKETKLSKILKCFGNFQNLIDFHEKNLNFNKKPYMITPCQHAFHTPCLESWFQRKRECPNCRSEILPE